ncbi:hypothetical protein BDW02DRAFT_583768 [Decorospora gaudefroyi]|uniref:Tachykinin family protein n=1 Tax=Decorospora gaudefroyi TaxID=184978 RepID=A0A6A5JX54_9PLEO|nr:hypothetical protein BDW02DRAFT_583768 [Decorospora gaudefroyi]
MASSNDPKPSRRRVGRRRLPPLAPGPALQFVVANHPDDFRADRTMRHVRSHVMYKHRENRGASDPDIARSREDSSALISMANTPSPTRTDPDAVSLTDSLLAPASTGYHDTYSRRTSSHSLDFLRTLAARILSATTTTAPVRSAPPAFDEPSEYPFPTSNAAAHESLEDLKRDWIQNTTFFAHDSSWMRHICDSRLSFLSHVHTTLVYKDLDEGLLYDSDLTVHAKTKILAFVSDGLCTDEVTLISILHLLISDIGSLDEHVSDLHQDGLATCMRNQRNGLGPNTAIFMTLVMLTFAISRGQAEPVQLAPRQSFQAIPDIGRPIFSFKAPLGHVSRLYGLLSAGTSGIIEDIQRCTDIFLAGWNHMGDAHGISSGQLATCDAQLQNIYSRLVLLSSTEDDPAPDWTYESCRIAALIYCRSIVYGTTFADSAQLTHARISGSSSESATLLSALHDAVGRTDKQGCWGSDLSGIFLWITLVGAAASWTLARSAPEAQKEHKPHSLHWMSKCFALYAVRAAVSVPFEHADATIRALRTMLEVQRLISVNEGSQTMGQ